MKQEKQTVLMPFTVLIFIGLALYTMYLHPIIILCIIAFYGLEYGIYNFKTLTNSIKIKLLQYAIKTLSDTSNKSDISIME